MSGASDVRWLRYLGIGFGALGVGLLIGCGFLTGGTRRFIATSERASGVVLRLEESTSTDRNGRTSTVYHPVVRFHTDGGREIVFRSDTGTSPPEYDAGDTVRVLYDPARPRRAKIDSFWSLWLGTVVLSVLGLAFLGAGFMVYRLEPMAFVGAARRRTWQARR